MPIQKFFSNRKLKSIRKRSTKILIEAHKLKHLSNEDLLKNAILNKSNHDTLLSYISVGVFKIYGFYPHEEQIIGSISLINKMIVQMNTGEGKTLTSAMAAIFLSIQGRQVILVTANQYLVERDLQVNKPLYDLFNISSGFNSPHISTQNKALQYTKYIMHSIGSELGFDYLKDNQVYSKADRVQPALDFVIIDEVDSILIDEGTVPLIISGKDNVPKEDLSAINRFSKVLKKGKREKKKGFMEEDFIESGDYVVDQQARSVFITEAGVSKIEANFKIDNLFEGAKSTELFHRITQAILVNNLFKHKKDYLVKDKKIILIDKHTGRLTPGRQMSGGIHQALEAKEGVEITSENISTGKISFQAFFNIFKDMSGLSGTVETDRDEFQEVYGLDVIVIPPTKKLIREDFKDVLLKNTEEKKNFLIEIVKREHSIGRPILIGTSSVKENILVAEAIKNSGLKANVLNAENEEDEAHIISEAGNLGTITVATNMAGRGVDIILDTDSVSKGGLLVIGFSKYHTRRIENQLRGRSGRQGDPGETIFLTSSSDDFFEVLKDEHRTKLSDLVSGSRKDVEKDGHKIIANVQRLNEEGGYEQRKSILKFDSSLNKQRESFYEIRNEFLKLDGDALIIKVENMVTLLYSGLKTGEYLDEVVFQETFKRVYEEKFQNEKNLVEDIIGDLKKFPDKEYIGEMIKSIILREMDIGWGHFILEMETLLTGIHFLSNAGKDPFIEFSKLGFNYYNSFINRVRVSVVTRIDQIKVPSTKSESDIDKRIVTL